MPHFAIFDRANGLLQWDGSYGDAESALAAFDAAVGVVQGDDGLDALFEHYAVVEVTSDQMAAVNAWVEGGSKASEYPL